VAFKDESEIALQQAKTVLRTVVRLKHNLKIKEELNRLENELEARFLAALNDSQPFTFDIKELVDKVDRFDPQS
jgi:hypothetical protein